MGLLPRLFPCLAVVFGLLGAAAVPDASACDSAACAAAMRYSEGELAPGRWRADVSFRYVDQGRRLNGRDSAAAVLRPRIDLEQGGLEAATHEELGGAMTFLQVELSRGLTSSLSAVGAIPLFRHNTVDTRHLGAAPSPGHGHDAGGSIATRNTASGLGDAQVGLRWSALSGPQHGAVAGLGLKLPTGPSARAGADGVVDPMLQTGTGAADLVASLQYSFKASRTVLSATASLQKTTANGNGYRYGDDVVAAVSVAGPLGPRFVGQAQLKLQSAARHRFRGDPVPSTGLTLVQLAQGLRLRVNPGLSLYTTVQLPAYVRVNDSQLGPSVTVTAGFAKAF